CRPLTGKRSRCGLWICAQNYTRSLQAMGLDMKDQKIDLPPLPNPRHTDMGYWRQDMENYARAAIEPYAQRIVENEIYIKDINLDRSRLQCEVSFLKQEIEELEADRQRRGEPVYAYRRKGLNDFATC